MHLNNHIGHPPHSFNTSTILNICPTWRQKNPCHSIHSYSSAPRSPTAFLRSSQLHPTLQHQSQNQASQKQHTSSSLLKMTAIRQQSHSRRPRDLTLLEVKSTCGQSTCPGRTRTHPQSNTSMPCPRSQKSLRALERRKGCSISLSRRSRTYVIGSRAIWDWRRASTSSP